MKSIPVLFLPTFALPFRIPSLRLRWKYFLPSFALPILNPFLRRGSFLFLFLPSFALPILNPFLRLRRRIFLFLFLFPVSSFAQDSEGKLIMDKFSKCGVWIKHGFPEDSITWSGKCKSGLASGQGICVGFSKKREISRYEGNMEAGRPNGKGVHTFFGNQKLEGNFSNGEILNLKESCLKRLNKIVVSETDFEQTYVGDNNARQLYYHALVPEGKIKGALVLMPGTWETTEHVISSTQKLCEMAFDQQLAVLVLSINQRLTLTDPVLKMMNAMLNDAVKRYKIPQEKFVIGGFSMGGLFSLRYTELACEDTNKTAVKPVAVFSVDGPCDLANIYGMFQNKLSRYPGSPEPMYGIREMEAYCGGSPEKVMERYQYFSCYSNAEPDGGNAKYLVKTPLRIYSDVDPNWWLDNRGVDMYDLNALDQTAMVLILTAMGNKRAEFINAFQKGHRIEGYRHPHSWSLVEPVDCMKWIQEQLKDVK